MKRVADVMAERGSATRGHNVGWESIPDGNSFAEKGRQVARARTQGKFKRVGRAQRDGRARVDLSWEESLQLGWTTAIP